VTAPRVAIATLGCKVNTYDSAVIAERLQRAGCMLVSESAPADVVVVNSCTVTDAADAESRRVVRRARRDNPQARVILTGCYAQVRSSEAASLDGVDRVIGLNRLDDLVAAVTRPAAVVDRVAVSNSRRATTVATFGARGFRGQTRAFLKVQEGCNLFCTFCIVPLARGASRSLPPHTVLEEMKALAAAGFEEVVLTGVHLGGYGADLAPPRDLTWLMGAIIEQGLIARLRLSSIDPHEVSEPLVRLLATSPVACPHLHVPLQAGSDSVLHRMRRRNDTALARERLAMIRELLPDAAIGTDLIAGFPGEDDAAFEATLAFLTDSPVTYAHVFPYSVRSGTTAAKLDGRVATPLIVARARRLRTLAEAKRRAFAQRFDGAGAEILVEHSRDPGTGRLRGYSRNYLRALLEGPDDWRGRRIPTRLSVSSDGRVFAEADA